MRTSRGTTGGGALGWGCALALLGFSWAGPVAAQQPPDLGQVPIEELLLLGVQQVFGAADRLQPVTEVPSSVTIVTAGEISRFGYRTLADILRGVRGFYVTDDRNYSYVGARGFNRPGDYSTRILLLVNGHRVNDNVYDQASVGAEFGLDVAMFERVEVIRGPASSLYGTNALFAIVNVVTKTGASVNGASVEVHAGTLGTQLVRASAGRQLPGGMDVVLSATFERSAGVGRLYLPDFDPAGTNGGVAEDLDGERAGQIYGRFSVKNFALTGLVGRRYKDVPTASYSTLFNAHDPAQETTDGRVSLMAQHVQTLGTSRLTTEASLDRATYGGVYPFGGEEGAGTVTFRDGSAGWRWALNSRVIRTLPWRQTLTFGGEFVHNVRQDQWGAYPFESPDNRALTQSSRQGAAYVQDEIRVRPWLVVNGGLRHDKYAEFDRTTPRGAVILIPSANHSLKYLYGRAFRAPNAYELYYYSRTAPDLAPESIDTHEWMWEAYFGERLRTTVSTYRYRVSRLVELEPVSAPKDFVFRNAGTIRAAGLELESEVRLKRGAQAVASYALQDAEEPGSGSARLTNSPRHMAKLRLSMPGPTDRSFGSFEWQYLSRRATIRGIDVGATSVAHATLSLPLSHSVNVTAHLRNLFNARYSDPASEEHAGSSIEQNGRTLRVGLQWVFWNRK